MKKNIKIVLVISIIVIALLLTYIIIRKNLKPTVVTDKDYLYESVEQYLIQQEQPQYFSKEKYSTPNYNVKDFKVFTDIAKLGIRQQQDQTYVYVWALIESYYVQDGKLIENSGSSVPYKFIFENDEIVNYEIPRDGSEYTKSIKKIFPEDIRRMFNDSLVSNSNIKEQVKKYYFNNVKIEVLPDTVTNESAEILITDNNEIPYGWGVEFRIQQKINEEWEELKYVSDDIAWISIAYVPNENNQLTQKLNIKQYYGTLSSGTYRIVKPVYDNGYIDFYSNEFEIK